VKVAFIVRPGLFRTKGGDTIQVQQTASHLEQLGVEVAVKTADEKIVYEDYDLFHLFNISRPADVLSHIGKFNKPYVLSPIVVHYEHFDRHLRKGASRWLFRFLPGCRIEYLKTIARAVRGQEKLCSVAYLWKGHKASMREVIKNTAQVLPASPTESKELKAYNNEVVHSIVPLGIDSNIFSCDDDLVREQDLVLCVARIEGLKNQLNLIRALNGTQFRLILIGSPAPNHTKYYRQCRDEAGPNVQFIGYLPQVELKQYYRRANVHVLASHFENCGLSTLEAAAMGCKIVITRKGFVSDYIGDAGFYCDPESQGSILTAIEKAAAATVDPSLSERIRNSYTWQQTASSTAAVYKKILNV
jgi:glycosyltransferase involved in cell wall biosynthesis